MHSFRCVTRCDFWCDIASFRTILSGVIWFFAKISTRVRMKWIPGYGRVQVKCPIFLLFCVRESGVNEWWTSQQQLKANAGTFLPTLNRRVTFSARIFNIHYIFKYSTTVILPVSFSAVFVLKTCDVWPEPTNKLRQSPLIVHCGYSDISMSSIEASRAASTLAKYPLQWCPVVE